MLFNDKQELLDYLYEMDIDGDFIIHISRVEDMKIKSLDSIYVENKKGKLYIKSKLVENMTFLYGYTRLSEVIIKHQLIKVRPNYYMEGGE